jgi:hypothetical protein
MRREDLAYTLNGRKRGDEIRKEELKIAKDNGLVVVYGYSDDNLEFNGAIDDEIGAYEGIKVFINSKLEIKNKAKEGRKLVKAIWCPEDVACSWLIKSEIPNSPFDIMDRETNEVFCRGIVFDIKDI